MKIILKELVHEHSHVLESILGAIGLGVIVTDNCGKILFSNKAATTIIGDCSDYVLPEDWPRKYGLFLPDGLTLCPPAQSPLSLAIRGKEQDDLELVVITPGQASRRWCSINLKPLKSKNGDVEGAVLVLQDTTERKMLVAESARSNADLQQFAAAAAHDLQEPLRTVAGYMDLLAEHLANDLDAKASRYMKNAKEGVVRMQALINDLLSYSRIQSKPQILNLFDCTELATESVQNLHATILEHGASVVIDQLPTLLVDASQLTLLFQNLIANAIKFAVEGKPSVVQVSSKRKGFDYIFSVKDNGIGVSPEFFQRIFLVFQRLHPVADYPGTGIGLAICKRIVDRHGGRIWLESEPGQGSTIFFTLPAPLLEETHCHH